MGPSVPLCGGRDSNPEESNVKQWRRSEEEAGATVTGGCRHVVAPPAVVGVHSILVGD